MHFDLQALTSHKNYIRVIFFVSLFCYMVKRSTSTLKYLKPTVAGFALFVMATKMYESDEYGTGKQCWDQITIALIKCVPECVLISLCWRLPDANEFHRNVSRATAALHNCQRFL